MDSEEDDDNNNIIDVSNINVNYRLHFDKHIIRSNSGLSIIYMNIQSMRNKLHDLQKMIDGFGCRIDIIIITEIWFDEHENIFFNLNGYNGFYSNRPGGYGGTAIFVKYNIKASKLISENYDYCQILVVMLTDKKISIMSFYRSQKNTLDNFWVLVEKYLASYKQLYLFGDMNLNLLDVGDNDIRKYREIVLSYGFNFLNKIDKLYATRSRNGINTVIDHVITDIFNYNYEFCLSDTPLSDHKYIYLYIDKISLNKQKLNKSISILNYDKIYKNSNWSRLDDVMTTDELQNIFVDIIKDCTITKKISYRIVNKEWMTEEILKLRKIRDKYFRLHKRLANNAYVKSQYIHFSKLVASKIRTAKRTRISNKVASVVNHPKRLWGLLKEIIFNRPSVIEKSYCLDVANQVVSDLDFVVEYFNEYFVNMPHKISQNHSTLVRSNFDYINYNIVTSFQLNECSNDEIKEIILNLNIGSAAGLDGIPTKFLKQSVNNISFTIKTLINYCFRDGLFPDCLQIARVSPIHKSGNELDVNNYRPISILSNLAKIFEKAVLNRLETFLIKNNVISTKQFGFTQNSNTSSACSFLTNKLTMAFEEKKYCACIILDFQKAFDTVNIDILLWKLEKLGICGIPLNLFKNYLSNRIQTVQINEKRSSFKQVTIGVPQGSILGPCLFKIFINDMDFLKLKGTLQLFADDGLITYTSNTVEDLHSQMQFDLVLLQNWLEVNNLVLNSSKTKYVVFENKKIDTDYWNSNPLFYNNVLINRVCVFTYLGLHINSRLTWDDHIDHLKKVITPYIFAIKRSRNILNKKSLLLLYNAYIQSRLLYLSPIWSGCGVTKVKEMEILQKRALKFILNVPILYPTAKLFSEFNSLTNLLKRELLIFIYKIVNDKIKHNFSVSRVRDKHHYFTRRRSNFSIDFFSTAVGNNNVLYRGLPLFNDLPSLIKNCENINIFKKLLKEHMNLK